MGTNSVTMLGSSIPSSNKMGNPLGRWAVKNVVRSFLTPANRYQTQSSHTDEVLHYCNRAEQLVHNCPKVGRIGHTCKEIAPDKKEAVWNGTVMSLSRLPPLLARSEDIPILVETFLKEFSEKHQVPPKTCSLPSLVLLRQYPGPGNIRQLRNVIERLIITVGERSILPEYLPQEIRTSDKHVNTVTIPLGSSLEDIEREVIRQTLVEVTHHREQAAKFLGMSVRSLHYKIKEYDIEV